MAATATAEPLEEPLAVVVGADRRAVSLDPATDDRRLEIDVRVPQQRREVVAVGPEAGVLDVDHRERAVVEHHQVSGVVVAVTQHAPAGRLCCALGEIADLAQETVAALGAEPALDEVLDEEVHLEPEPGRVERGSRGPPGSLQRGGARGRDARREIDGGVVQLSLIHISEPTRQRRKSRMPSCG